MNKRKATYDPYKHVIKDTLFRWGIWCFTAGWVSGAAVITLLLAHSGNLRQPALEACQSTSCQQFSQL